MSVLLALRLNNTAVLASDSRLYDASASTFLSDNGQKLYDCGCGVFIGWAGFSPIGQLQAATAARFVSEGTTDLRELADRLDEVCGAAVRQTLEAVAPMRAQPAIHSYALCGSGGFIGRGFHLQDGKLNVSETDGRHSPFALFGAAASSADTALITQLAHIPGWWLDGVKGIELIIEALRATNPLIGGAIQMVSVDQSGTRWIHRPALEDMAEPASGTITALVQMISPTITGGNITGATLTLNQNGVSTEITNQALPGLSLIAGAKVRNTSTNEFAAITPGEIGLFDASSPSIAYVYLLQNGTIGSVRVQNRTNFANSAELQPGRLYMNGTAVVGPQQTDPGAPSFSSVADTQTWCANLRTALKAHGLI